MTALHSSFLVNRRSATAALLAAALLTLGATSNDHRYVDGEVFVSESTPAFEMRVDEGLGYVGAIDFVLWDKARAQRHHWVDANESGEIDRLLILQFESFLDSVEGNYSFGIPADDQAAGSNYRFSPQEITLGGHGYVHNTWAYDNAQNMREKTDGEAARTGRFLEERGLRLDAEVVMSRFVRAVGDDARNELIIFYIEPIAALGHHLDDFPDGGPPSETYDQMSAGLLQRSLAAFEFRSSTRP